MVKTGAISTAVKPKATASSASSAAKKKAPAKTKLTTVADQYDADLPAALRVGSVRESRGLGELMSEGGIASEFPSDDLSKIETHERHAAGFRLDGGSVRSMWVSARRFEESEGKKGYEIFFFAHGAAVQSLKERFEEQGAKKGTFHFFSGDVAAKKSDGKSCIKRNKTTWSASATNALKLEQAGKFVAELNAGDPETLKGAVRIRVYGTDAAATKALKDVEKKLGLQHVFSPPTPNALERFKLMRLLWSIAPEETSKLRWKSFDEVTDDDIEKALHAAEVAKNGADMKAVNSANLGDEQVKKRVHLGGLLLEKNPKRFIEWVSSEYYSKAGILPDPQYSWNTDYSLNNALEEAGVKEGSAAYKKALAKPKPKKEEAERVMLFGLLAKKDKSAAEALLSKSMEDISLADVQAALKKEGIDPSSKRVKDLKFEEVYPGYFTVIDPAFADKMHKAGARYLYSTADNVERVWSILSSGQKASLTRFSEGLLIQGKSSSSDFPTGGAQAVFTRLVTRSIIEKAKKEKPKTDSYYSYSYHGETGFNNWGGSRPYKVILNPSILGRLDWWGYNSDNFGRSTNLTAENHGEQLIKEIDKNYSSSNELMFPVGNDPAYIDFVVCESEEQKKELIKKLKDEGFKEFNGRPLSEFVRVETKFFEHPDD